MTKASSENTTKLRWRILSGLLAGLTLATALIALLSRLFLNWQRSSIDYDDTGLLYDAPVWLGYTVPDIGFFSTLILCSLPVIGLVMQFKPWMPTLATKWSCLVLTLMLFVAGWFAYVELGHYWNELTWLYHT
ncbi:hypothetical protein N9Y42_06835 [Mariniblastus sp.]|nr:hypothetical protein [Mariniblastus sp.]